MTKEKLSEHALAELKFKTKFNLQPALADFEIPRSIGYRGPQYYPYERVSQAINFFLLGVSFGLAIGGLVFAIILTSR